MNDPVMQHVPSHPSPETPQSSQTPILLYTTVAIGLALFIRFFIAAPYVVSGASMEPTFHDWHYLIIDRISYDLHKPQRGDVIVFDMPQEGGKSLIKRIIGLPGETIEVRGDSVAITNAEHPEGFTLSEPYLDERNLGGATTMRVTLGDDQFFVLGDNRTVSADSRVWGALDRERIVGRVFVRLFPFNALGILPGQSRYEE